eukprot:INCI19273.1.p1 GENE.INCI19273.1~~INCI19273.1.p1  ORF type:complete len:267 (+),score=68.80 INCI19273.1:180-980(+)
MPAVPLRLALRYSPPTLACEYKSDDGGLKTLKIEFENVTADTDVREMLQLATAKLDEVVSVADLDEDQLRSLMDKLVVGCTGGASSKSKSAAAEQELDTDDLPDDLKAAMGLDVGDSSEKADKPSSTFSNLTLPGHGADDSSRLSDKSSKSSTTSQKKKPNAADDEGFDDLLDDLLGDDIDAPLETKPTARTSASSYARTTAAPEPEPESEQEEEDLNKVSDFRLRMAKKQMDEQFEKNLLRPGMEGYEYDKAVDFGEAESDGSWD